MPTLLISKLPDGRLLWLKPSGALVWDGKGWAPAKGITVGDSLEGTFLADSEIADLIASGIVSQ